MDRYFKIPLTIFLLSLASAAMTSNAELSGDAIVLKADDGRIPPGSVAFSCDVRDFDKGEMNHETHYKVLNKGKTKSLVETTFPERQRGRKLLMDGENLWFSTPDIKRPARVSMQQKLTGEVANGDLARTNYSGDYSATVVGHEKINSKDTFQLKLIAKHSGVTYSKIDYWVTTTDFLPVKAVFYAVSGKVLKTGIFSEPHSVLGRVCVTKTVFTDSLDKSHVSVLLYHDFKHTEIPDDVISKEGLSE